MPISKTQYYRSDHWFSIDSMTIRNGRIEFTIPKISPNNYDNTSYADEIEGHTNITEISLEGLIVQTFDEDELCLLVAWERD